MAGLKDIPFSQLTGLYSAGKKADKRRRVQLCLAIVVDPTADPDLIYAVKDAFVPELSTASIRLFRLGQATPEEILASSCDAVLIISKNEEDSASAICRLCLREKLSCAVLCKQREDACFEALDEENAPRVVAISGKTPEAFLDALAEWLLKALPNLELALATNFSFIREIRVDQLINESAKKNAAVGVITLIPGADLPVMTINQLKMAIDIAAMYGFDLSKERLPEIVGVIANGLLFRGLARGALSFIPVFGWALKGAFGYAGTLAAGRALKARFDANSALRNKIDTQRLKSSLRATLQKFSKTRSAEKGIATEA